MFVIKESEKTKTLIDLITLSRSIDEILQDLSKYSPESSEDLVRIDIKDIHSVLTRALSGNVTTGDLEKWANVIEGNESIAFETENCKEIIFNLANPEINSPLNPELYRYLLKKYFL